MKPDFQIITEGDSKAIHNEWPRFLDCFPPDEKTGMVAICTEAVSGDYVGGVWRKVAKFQWVTPDEREKILAE